MGRWLKKIVNAPESPLTKPTEPSFVGFVTIDSELIQKNNVNIIRFITQSCSGFKVDPQKVMDNLLSIEDELDIKNGNMTAEELRAHVELWLTNGMPYQAGKLG